MQMLAPSSCRICSLWWRHSWVYTREGLPNYTLPTLTRFHGAAPFLGAQFLGRRAVYENRSDSADGDWNRVDRLAVHSEDAGGFVTRPSSAVAASVGSSLFSPMQFTAVTWLSVPRHTPSNICRDAAHVLSTQYPAAATIMAAATSASTSWMRKQ